MPEALDRGRACTPISSVAKLSHRREFARWQERWADLPLRAVRNATKIPQGARWGDLGNFGSGLSAFAGACSQVLSDDEVVS
jgi:hypothetical protein